MPKRSYLACAFESVDGGADKADVYSMGTPCAWIATRRNVFTWPAVHRHAANIHASTVKLFSRPRIGHDTALRLAVAVSFIDILPRA